MAVRTPIRAKRPEGYLCTVFIAEEGDTCLKCGRSIPTGEHVTKRRAIGITRNGFKDQYLVHCKDCEPFTEIG